MRGQFLSHNQLEHFLRHVATPPLITAKVARTTRQCTSLFVFGGGECDYFIRLWCFFVFELVCLSRSLHAILLLKVEATQWASRKIACYVLNTIRKMVEKSTHMAHILFKCKGNGEQASPNHLPRHRCTRRTRAWFWPTSTARTPTPRTRPTSCGSFPSRTTRTTSESSFS